LPQPRHGDDARYAPSAIDPETDMDGDIALMQRLRDLKRARLHQLCRERLTAFAAEVLAGQGHRLAAHHRLILGKLEALARGTLSNPGGRPLRQLMAIMPPGASKTTLCSQIFPVWFMALRPGCRILLISHTETFAEANSVTIQNLIREHAGLLGFDVATDARGEWRTTNQ
jgi:hypothetical protein